MCANSLLNLWQQVIYKVYRNPSHNSDSLIPNTLANLLRLRRLRMRSLRSIAPT